MAGGSLVSAAAPSFLALAVAQVPLWIGVAVLVAAGVGAAGVWSVPGTQTRIVARALAGAPAAWVVGMPVIGVASGVSWAACLSRRSFAGSRPDRCPGAHESASPPEPSLGHVSFPSRLHWREERHYAGRTSLCGDSRDPAVATAPRRPHRQVRRRSAEEEDGERDGDGGMTTERERSAPE